MRELLLSLPVAVAYVAGPDLVFEFANENYYRAVGRRDLIGRPYAEMLAEVVVGQPQYKAAVFRELRTGEPRARREEVWSAGKVPSRSGFASIPPTCLCGTSQAVSSAC